MVAWTGIEHFRMGRFDPPPSANELEDARVSLLSSLILIIYKSEWYLTFTSLLICCSGNIILFYCTLTLFVSLLPLLYFENEK